jgi:hypothetical protein
MHTKRTLENWMIWGQAGVTAFIDRISWSWDVIH